MRQAMFIEKEANWSTVFPIMAFARQFGFYLLIITFWMHFKQMNMNEYVGILGFILIYSFKYAGVCLVRNSLAKLIPRSRGMQVSETPYGQTSPPRGMARSGAFDLASSHMQIKVNSGNRRSNSCESVKTTLVIANICGLISASIFFCFTGESDLNEFLLMLSLILFGVW